ncbi:unnamed protein product, partial [Callosobruchus maculatus]
MSHIYENTHNFTYLLKQHAQPRLFRFRLIFWRLPRRPLAADCLTSFYQWRCLRCRYVCLSSILCLNLDGSLLQLGRKNFVFGRFRGPCPFSKMDAEKFGG